MRADPRPELHDCDERIAIVRVPTLASVSGLRPHRRERAVIAVGEWDRDARRCVVISRPDRSADPLEAVDLAPGHLPAAEVALKARDCVAERLKLLRRAGVASEATRDEVAVLRGRG